MFKQWVSRMEESGWKITLRETDATLPESIHERYPVPGAWERFIAPVASCVSADGNVRFLTFEDYQSNAGDTPWNMLEQQSMQAAGDDDAQQALVTGFWNYHLPIVLCTGEKHAYYAIDAQFGSVVYGEAPECETAEVVAESFDAFIQKIIEGAIKL